MELVGERYELVRSLGAGAGGEAWLGRRTDDGQSVVVKLLHEKLARSTRHQERFRREVLALAKLRHPHVVELLDCGRCERRGQPYFVMAFSPGVSLEKVLKEAPRLDARRALRLIDQLLQALELAHGDGILHRDLKPDNLLVERAGAPDEHLRVLDFGLAKHQKGGKQTQAELTEGIVGTPLYLAPEQCRATGISPATDIYAVGCILMRIVGGAAPFGGSLTSILRDHVLTPAPRLRSLEASAPAALDDLVAACLDKAPEKRPTAAALRRALLDIARALPSTPSRPAQATPRLDATIDDEDVLPLPTHVAATRIEPPPGVSGTAATLRDGTVLPLPDSGSTLPEGRILPLPPASTRFAPGQHPPTSGSGVFAPAQPPASGAGVLAPGRPPTSGSGVLAPGQPPASGSGVFAPGRPPTSGSGVFAPGPPSFAPAPSGALRVRLDVGASGAHVLVVAGGRMRLGADPGNEVALQAWPRPGEPPGVTAERGRRVAPWHAELRLEPRRAAVEDLGSHQGTALDDDRLAPRAAYTLRSSFRLGLGGGVELAGAVVDDLGERVVRLRRPAEGDHVLYVLVATTATIGASPADAVHLALPGVAPGHALLDLAGPDVVLVAGRAEVELAGRRLAPGQRAVVAPGDVVRLGATSLRVS